MFILQLLHVCEIEDVAGLFNLPQTRAKFFIRRMESCPLTGGVLKLVIVFQRIVEEGKIRYLAVVLSSEIGAEDFLVGLGVALHDP